MDEQAERQLGEELLTEIRKHSASSGQLGGLVEQGLAARHEDSISPVEARFFEQVDELRQSDPREFEQLSPEIRASYGSWKWARESGS